MNKIHGHDYLMFTEEIAIKSEKQCLKMQGGKLMTVDCNAMMYYTCERPAVVSGKIKCFNVRVF